MNNSNGSKGYVVAVERDGRRIVFDYQLFQDPGNMVPLVEGGDHRLREAIVRYGLMCMINGEVFEIVPYIGAEDEGKKACVGEPVFRCRLNSRKKDVEEVKKPNALEAALT